MVLRINQGRFRGRGCDTAEGRGHQRGLLENIQADSQGWASVESQHRVYEEIHFNKRKPLRKRLSARVKKPLVTPDQENVTWSMDFVTDVLQSNRKFRVLNVIDDSDRVAVAQKVAHSIPTSRLIRFMEEIIWEKGKPTNIRSDNGPEFISHEFQDWCDGNGIKILYTQPGCPAQLLQQRKTSRLLEQPRSNGVSVDENRVILYTLN